MDPETAKHRFENDAILVFLDSPVGMEFGIDYQAWDTGERFRGVKMIPPGLHFVYWW